MEKINLNDISLPKLSESQKIGSNLLRQVENMDDIEFEKFVFEWVKYCKYKNKNVDVYRIGGTGDHGLDIIVFEDDFEIAYQCKHYSKKINRATIRDIVVKILWYYFKDFDSNKYPKQIIIIALNDFSVDGVRYLENSTTMTNDCLNNFKISLDNEDIARSNDEEKKFSNYLTKFMFCNVMSIPVSNIVSDYYNSEIGFFRFKKEPTRFDRISINESKYELKFVNQIEKALDTSALSLEDKINYLNIAKSDYFSAVSLKETCYYFFGNYDEFINIEKEISDFLKQKQFSAYDNSFVRMNNILNDVGSFSLDSSFLNYSLHMVTFMDKKGTCHMVVNDGNFYWSK